MCLSEVRRPLVDLGVSEYGILSAISTLSDTQNDLGLMQSSSGSESCCSVDEISLFRQIVLDLREFKRKKNKSFITAEMEAFGFIYSFHIFKKKQKYLKSVGVLWLKLVFVLASERSFPTHRSLMGDSPEAIEGQAKLFRVLIAYAKYNPQVGYSQGKTEDYFWTTFWCFCVAGQTVLL